MLITKVKIAFLPLNSLSKVINTTSLQIHSNDFPIAVRMRGAGEEIIRLFLNIYLMLGYL